MYTNEHCATTQIPDPFGPDKYIV